jgi:hypothetical protein
MAQLIAESIAAAYHVADKVVQLCWARLQLLNACCDVIQRNQRRLARHVE